MPYRRNYRRRRPRRRRYKKKYGYFGAAGSDARKAIRMAGKALALINPEHKYLDRTLTFPVPLGGVVNCMYLPVQGDAAINRDGDSVKITDIMFRMAIFKQPSPQSTCVRVMLLIDTQSNGALPSITDVLTTGDVYSYRNLSYGNRFTVLYDKSHHLNSPNNAAGITPSSSSTKWIEYYKKIPLHVEFKGNTGTVADISTNSLLLICISDDAVSPIANVNLRTRWLDN